MDYSQKEKDISFLDCLIEKNDGYIIRFKEQNSTLEDSKNFLHFIYLNNSKKTVDDLMGEIKLDPKTNFVSKDFNRKTTLIVSSLSKDQINKIISGVGLDEDLQILNEQIEKI